MARPGRGFHPQHVAKPYIVTDSLQLVAKETILLAAAERGLQLETGKFVKGKPVKVKLVKIAEQLGINGQFFRSQREAARWVALKRAEAERIVWDLKRDPRWILHTVNPAGLKVAISEYTADFEYWERLDRTQLAVTLFHEAPGIRHVIEESKGFPTKDWELRKKWVEAEYDITIRVT